MRKEQTAARGDTISLTSPSFRPHRLQHQPVTADSVQSFSLVFNVHSGMEVIKAISLDRLFAFPKTALWVPSLASSGYINQGDFDWSNSAWGQGAGMFPCFPYLNHLLPVQNPHLNLVMPACQPARPPYCGFRNGFGGQKDAEGKSKSLLQQHCFTQKSDPCVFYMCFIVGGGENIGRLDAIHFGLQDWPLKGHSSHAALSPL